MEPKNPLHDLGRTIAEEQNRQLRDRDVLALTRARLVGASEPPSVVPMHPFPRRAAIAVCVAAAVALFAWKNRAPHLEFQVAGAPGNEDTWLAAPTASSLPLRFSDGTSIDLAPAARARVSRSLVYALLRRGLLPAMRIGARGRGKWVIDAADLERFLASCKTAGLPEGGETFTFLG